MPTYDYQCSACSHAFEEFHGINEAPLKKCPKCGKLKLARLIGTGGAILFKGGGFYSTDYRSDSYKSGAKADSGPSCSGNPSSCAKPDCSSKSDS
jgi:putative FmdB family regulatory protein